MDNQQDLNLEEGGVRGGEETGGREETVGGEGGEETGGGERKGIKKRRLYLELVIQVVGEQVRTGTQTGNRIQYK